MTRSVLGASSDATSYINFPSTAGYGVGSSRASSCISVAVYARLQLPTMSRFFLLAFFCAWFSSAAALLPALPINDTASSSFASRFLHASRVHCSGTQFGIGLSRIRCDNAWEKIEQSIQPRLFAQRDTEQDIFSLPFRYLSGALLRCDSRYRCLRGTTRHISCVLTWRLRDIELIHCNEPIEILAC